MKLLIAFFTFIGIMVCIHWVFDKVASTFINRGTKNEEKRDSLRAARIHAKFILHEQAPKEANLTRAFKLIDEAHYELQIDHIVDEVCNLNKDIGKSKKVRLLDKHKQNYLNMLYRKGHYDLYYKKLAQFETNTHRKIKL